MTRRVNPRLVKAKECVQKSQESQVTSDNVDLNSLTSEASKETPTEKIKNHAGDENISSDELSLLSHSELISELKKARARIQHLESIVPVQSLYEHTVQKSDFQSVNSKNSLAEKEFTTEKGAIFSPGKSGEKPRFDTTNEGELFVAFEHKGEFLNCDEDLVLLHKYVNEEPNQSDNLIEEIAWRNEEDENENDDFPLVPSPLLNTPPYEYIFLTKQNEAKFRIFLNPKLNKVFQEEFVKLRKQEEVQSANSNSHEKGENKTLSSTNHINCNDANVSHSLSHATNPSSTANIIHCFDPSDVDLELKKIFMEKPPITHKIVRRKSRRKRGSSVPGIDSYYGTKDIGKVGHASYFIPTLTESERKAIGWKSEYHYGHWKYTALNVPNQAANQIFLHPHPQTEKEATQSKHISLHQNNAAFLSQNPLHQKEIDLSESLLGESVNATPPQKVTSPSPQHQHHYHHPSCKYFHEEVISDQEDTLSFITLSGSSGNPTQSCHIIPDKGTLRKILKWILSSCTKPDVNSEASLTETGGSGITGEIISCREKVQPEIETIVKPASNMTFQTQTSQTQIGLEAMGLKDSGTQQKQPQATKIGSKNNNGHQNRHQSESPQSQHNSHSHHHHHFGFFHWKNILAHMPKSKESMSVVGGDVVESHFGSTVTSQCLDTVHVDTLENLYKKTVAGSGGQADVNNSEMSSTEESSDDSKERSSKVKVPRKTRKQTKRLKPSKAFTRLLTLKDLGYEPDQLDFKLQSSNHQKDRQIRKMMTV